MAGKSKILIIGGTGYIGKFIVEASANAGHPTFVLVRESTLSNSASHKSHLIQGFRNSGVTFVLGDLYDHESLVNAIKQVDVVISTVGYAQLNDQDKILAAIKEVGNVKRFFPSEFGNDVDRVHAVEPAKSTFQHKAQFRRLVEAAGVPYTYVSSNFFAGIFVRTLAQLDTTAPPRDKVVILGSNANKTAASPSFVFNKETLEFTVQGASGIHLTGVVKLDRRFPISIRQSTVRFLYIIGKKISPLILSKLWDPRTLNKILYIRPPANSISMNVLTTLWENKIGKKLERIYVTEEQVLKDIQEASAPLNVRLGISHSVFVKGDQTNFEI